VLPSFPFGFSFDRPSFSPNRPSSSPKRPFRGLSCPSSSRRIGENAHSKSRNNVLDKRFAPIDCDALLRHETRRH
jgi:hypothetical protein